MAIYRLETKIISRQNRGRSVIPSAAYRSGSILHKAAYRSGNVLEHALAKFTFNYKARAQEVVHTEIMAPKDGPSWLQTPKESKGDLAFQRDMRERLWNAIEKIEKRKDSQLAREFIAALPRELSREQQIELVRGWCNKEFVSKGFVVDFAIHKSKTGKNPHTHILITTRPVEGESFGKKPSTAGKFNGRGLVGKFGKSELIAWRASWRTDANMALEKAGSLERIDHRSLKDRGINRQPEPKIGTSATAMMRKGLDPERSKLWRYVRTLNVMKPLARSIDTVSELAQTGMGKTWWERSLVFMSRAREAAESAVDTLRGLARLRTPGQQLIPPRERGPDLER